MRHIDPQAPVLVVIALALSGCGAGGFAPESPQSNAFLDQLAANCGKHSIGNQPIEYLLDINSSDATVSGLLLGRSRQAAHEAAPLALYADCGVI